MVPRFAKRIAKSSLDLLGFSLHDLRKNNDLRVFLPGHLKSLFSKLAINCVIDVGANIGEYGLMLRRMGYQGRIVSIEPVGDLFEKLTATAGGDDRWITVNAACGSKEERKPISIFAGNPQLSSFLAPSANMPVLFPSPMERTELVDVKRLDSLFDYALDGLAEPRVFVKTDCQGLDLDVIKSAGGVISKVEALQSEVALIPLYVSAPDYLEFLSYCRSIDFEPSAFFPIINSPLGHLIECDVVLIRKHWNDYQSALVEPALAGNSQRSMADQNEFVS